MSWVSTDILGVTSDDSMLEKNNGANKATSFAVGDFGDGSRLIETVFDIVNAGLKFASELIG